MSNSSSVENVLLIIVDSLRADRIHDSSLTPTIGALADSGKRFDKCYSCINATDSSLTTILSGQYPTRHGLLNHGKNVTNKEMSRVRQTTPIPARLPPKYSTTAVQNLHRWHERGFDEYVNPLHSDDNLVLDALGNLLSKFPTPIQENIRRGYHRIADGGDATARSRPSLTAEKVTESTISTLEETDGPWFTLVHYWDAHIPYSPLDEVPQDIMDRDYEEDDVSLETLYEDIEGSHWEEQLRAFAGEAESVGDMIRRYDAGVRKADDAIGNLLTYLEKNDLKEETAIIMTGDHGESLIEHGIYFDHHGLYDPTTHVPLVVDSPEFDGQSDTFVQHYDIAPTVLSLLDVEYDEDEFDGTALQNMERQEERPAVYAEEAHTNRKRSIRTAEWRLTYELDSGDPCRYCDVQHAPPVELYNLTTDTAETEDVSDMYEERVTELREAAEEWIDNRPKVTGDGEGDEGRAAPAEDVLEHLEELGYK